jgi:SAM-dependent methyltransferase
MRVLDIGCGRGCHAILAAERGADVTAVDADAEALKAAEKAARKAAAAVHWIKLDPAHDRLPQGPFDLVMVLGGFDRRRLADYLGTVRPGGFLLGEAFLEQQRDLGWGPTDQARLLKSGEVWTLFQPFDLIEVREVLEILDGRTLAVASALARRPPQS